MKVEGTRSFQARRETVWAVMNDPGAMAKTMPGVESFDVQDDRHWSAKVKIPLGLGGLKMSINFEKLEEREPEYARMHAKGTGVGALMNLETQFHLAETGASTEMRWEADVRIAGPVGSMGQRVLQPIVNQQVKNVLAALEEQVQAAAGEGGSTGDAGGAPAEVPGGGMPMPPPEPGVPRLETPSGSGYVESVAAQTPPQGGEGGGMAGAPAPWSGVRAETDPELKDYGPPADSSPDADPASVEGSSGAEEGISPWAPEGYSDEPEGPTQTTQGPPPPQH